MSDLYPTDPVDDGLTVAAEGLLLLGALGIAAGVLAVAAPVAAVAWLKGYVGHRR